MDSPLMDFFGQRPLGRIGAGLEFTGMQGRGMAVNNQGNGFQRREEEAPGTRQRFTASLSYPQLSSVYRLYIPVPSSDHTLWLLRGSFTITAGFPPGGGGPANDQTVTIMNGNKLVRTFYIAHADFVNGLIIPFDFSPGTAMDIGRDVTVNWTPTGFGIGPTPAVTIEMAGWTTLH